MVKIINPHITFSTNRKERCEEEARERKKKDKKYGLLDNKIKGE